MPEQVGILEEVLFWPEWRLENEVASAFGKSRVQPDVFIRFTDLDLIIEAKRWDADDMQYDLQLASEWIAGDPSETSSQNRRRLLFAVGGLKDMNLKGASALRSSVQKLISENVELPQHPVVYAFSWASLLQELMRLREDLNARHRVDESSQLFVINDLIEALDLHSIFPHRFLCELPSLVSNCLDLASGSLQAFADSDSSESAFGAIADIAATLGPIRGESLRLFSRIPQLTEEQRYVG